MGGARLNGMERMILNPRVLILCVTPKEQVVLTAENSNLNLRCLLRAGYWQDSFPQIIPNHGKTLKSRDW